MRIRLLAAVLLIAGCTIDEGGGIYARARELAADPVSRPITGVCISACTMRLVRDCVTPGALLAFHIPRPDTPRNRLFMSAHFPTEIAIWFIEEPTNAPPRWMMGSEAIRLGATPCATDHG